MNYLDALHPFTRTCAKGMLEEAKRLLPETEYEDCCDGFRMACACGFLDVARWLCAEKQFDDAEWLEAFGQASFHGQLHVAQWMLVEKPELYISATEIKQLWVLQLACHRRYLDFAKWLISLNPDINLSYNNEQLFRAACSTGCLEVAQWLLSVKPTIDISAKNDYAFYSVCNTYNRRDNVAKWLISLKPERYCIDERTGSPRMRTPEEQRWYRREQQWARRKYLVWLQSRQSPNKDSLMYKLPSDVSRKIVMEFV